MVYPSNRYPSSGADITPSVPTELADQIAFDCMWKASRTIYHEEVEGRLVLLSKHSALVRAVTYGKCFTELREMTTLFFEERDCILQRGKAGTIIFRTPLLKHKFPSLSQHLTWKDVSEASPLTPTLRYTNVSVGMKTPMLIHHHSSTATHSTRNSAGGVKRPRIVSPPPTTPTSSGKVEKTSSENQEIVEDDDEDHNTASLEHMAYFTTVTSLQSRVHRLEVKIATLEQEGSRRVHTQPVSLGQSTVPQPLPPQVGRWERVLRKYCCQIKPNTCWEM
eukprot:PhF_6_TR17426/c0_g1_i2/m.26672